MDFIGWIVGGIIAGWLAGVITKTDRGILGDLVLGLAGGLLAGWLTDISFGGDSNWLLSIAIATIFAVILVVIKNAVLSRR